MNDLVSFLQKEVESRERAAHLIKPRENQREAFSTQKQHKPDSNREKWRKANVPSAAALHTVSSNAPVHGCIFCNSTNHKSEQCTEDTVTSRKDKLRKMGRFYICTKPRHLARDCRSKNVTCTDCGRRHHAVSCDKGEQQAENEDAVENTSDALVSSVIPQAAKMTPEKCETVLLQTVRVSIEGPGGKATVRCLIDGGIQRSFIREKQVKDLNLRILKQETLNLHTFGSKNPVTTKCNVIRLVLENLRNKHQKIEIEAVQTPQLCTAVMKVPSKHIQQQLEKKGLPVADVSSGGKEDLELSVLIGADYYWRVVTGKTERLSDALVAIETTFGWAVQGPVVMSSINEATCMHIGLSDNSVEIR